MTDTAETLQAALDDLRDRHKEAMKSLAKWSIEVDEAVARVAAFEKAQRAEVEREPRQLRDDEWDMLEKQYHRAIPDTVNMMQCKAAARLRYLESAHAADQAELARLREENAALREAQKAHGQDITSFELRSWADDNDFEYNPNTQKEYIRRQCRAMAREIARRRGLTLDGAK